MPRLVREAVEEVGPQRKEPQVGIFGTRNNDGASGLAESCNNISTAKYRALQERARDANPDKAAIFPTTPAAEAYRQAHRREKAGEN